MAEAAKSSMCGGLITDKKEVMLPAWATGYAGGADGLYRYAMG